MADTHRLYNLALTFGGRKLTSKMRPIQFFYRNQSFEYFQVIMNQMNGLMMPYMKSNGGEQGSVLNGRFPGIFFSTSIDINTKLPSPSSYYGPMRFYIQFAEIFNAHCNIYFADFYCHYKRHHVTVILTPKMAPYNKYCQKYLVQLDIFDNPYLCLQFDKYQNLTILANMGVTVDVIYTETIDIKDIIRRRVGFFEETKTMGRGYIVPTAKNSSCRICNVH